ncbi:hypothetical protein GCM10027040_28150 [Halomonas shantousis]
MRQLFDRLERTYGLDTVTRRARQGVWAGFAALIVLLLLGGLQLYQSGQSGLAPVLVRVLPLLLFLPSIMTQRPRGHAWLAFVSLLYFMQGTMIATLPDKTWLGLLEIAASLLLFVASMSFARWRSRQLRQ